ncbi:ABC transporter ATP-binding protein [Malaciobacter marinus]|uniref:ABC transporter ATP-binding protein n=1 Tax=Malaciobacter marinus TaxID=505249 RepID=UPI0009A5FBA1|nr:ABC transporter ATP-binding protein [Malaciobacter marinus]SKB48933.1 ATP-binding cassette, subfamily B [Malaciobacter marinus]
MENEKMKKSLWAIMKPVNLHINSAILLAAFSGITSVIALTFLAFVVSLSVDKNATFLGITMDFNTAFIYLAVITFISFFSRKYAFIISHFGAFKLEEILRTNLSKHLAKVPLGFITTTGTGKLKKVLLDDIKNLHAFVADTTPMIGRSISTPIASLILMLIIDYRLACASIVVLILGVIIMSYVMKDSQVYRQAYENSQSNINKAVVEFVQAMPIVRTFDDGTSSFKRYNESLENYKTNLKNWINETGVAAKFAMAILSPMPTILAVSGIGAYFVLNGSLDLVSFLAVLLIATGMSDALMPLMWMSNFVKKSQAAAYRIADISNEEELYYSNKVKELNSFDIEFKNVGFKYENRDSNALENINFEVKQGTKTAIIGSSGAGKSTIAKLIPRFWDVNSGEILIDNQNIKDIDSKTLMNSVAFVFQDTYLFHDTIKNNIKLANEKASDEQVIQACKAAQIHEFIMTLPNGYDTLVGDKGSRLSGGQKQRVTIARAILRDAQIIVLDEATSYADAQSEEKLIKALANLMKNKTVIIIAHRLSTIKDADQILLFEKGRLISKGTHEELIKNSFDYIDLYTSYEKAYNWDIANKGNHNDK